MVLSLKLIKGEKLKNALLTGVYLNLVWLSLSFKSGNLEKCQQNF